MNTKNNNQGSKTNQDPKITNALKEIEDINDPVEGPHQHIDMIYICKPINDEPMLNDDNSQASRTYIFLGNGIFQSIFINFKRS